LTPGPEGANILTLIETFHLWGETHMTRYGFVLKHRLALAVVAAVVAAAVGQAVHAPEVLAANTQYFIDPNNPACSDTGGGTSTTPWCGLVPASSHVFGPGDQVLLANGSLFTGRELDIQGQGTATRPILVSSFAGFSSSTARPHIDGNGNALAVDVLLQNPSYVTVSNLEVSGAGGGIVADYNSSYPVGVVTGNQGLTFSNIYAHHITGITQGSPTGAQGSSQWDPTCSQNHDLWVSSGISITGAFTANVPSGQYGVSGVTFNDIEGNHNFDTISTDWCDAQFGNPNGPGNAPHPNLIQNVVVNHMYAHDGDGGGVTGMCGEGFRLSGTTNALVINSRLINLGACPVSTGTAGVILVSVTNVTFANDIIAGVPNTNSADLTGIDHEVYNDQVKFRNVLIANNAGPGTEFLTIRSNISDYSTNNEMTGNSFYGNFVSMKHVGGGVGVPFTFRTPLSNNVYADSDFVSPASDFTMGSGNVAARQGAVPQYAANQYSSTQGFDNWSYQYGGTGAWQSMTSATSQNADLDWPWGGGNSEYLSRFEQAPGSGGQPAARTWTAPATGTIAIRSRVLKSTASGGSNVTAQITANDVVVNSAVNVSAGDQTGLEDNVDQLAVKAGDVIRFVLSGGAPSNSTDLTSWAPSITYVNATPGATGTFGDWSFETPSLGAGQYQYGLTGTPWTFMPASSNGGSGIASNGSGFGNPNAPDGTQVAFMQKIGSISQVVNGFAAGTKYSITFYAAQRPGNSQTLNVNIDGRLLDTFTPPGSFTSHTTPTFSLDSASHLISITGTQTSDQTAFVDAVRLNATSTGLTVPNNGFETPTLSAGSYLYAPISGSSWSFVGHSGLASNGSGFGNPNAPQGTQVAFLQDTGSFSQSISGFTGTASYIVAFMASQRPNIGNQQGIKVSIDGTALTTISPVGDGFSFYVTPVFSPTAGAHTVLLAGTQATDQTAFVDAVQIIPVAASSVAPTNGSFESPVLSPGSFQYAPTTPGWAFDPAHAGRGVAGIVSNGSAYGNPNAPNGVQAAFLQQAGMTQSAGQTNASASIQYCSLTMWFAPRGSQTQTLAITIDGNPVGQITPTGSSYTAWTSAGYILQPGAKGAIQIMGGKTGTVLSDDNTAFVDNISTMCGS
jgi:hypothetical protein